MSFVAILSKSREKKKSVDYVLNEVMSWLWAARIYKLLLISDFQWIQRPFHPTDLTYAQR